jgi:hypothetical protein
VARHRRIHGYTHVALPGGFGKPLTGSPKAVAGSLDVLGRLSHEDRLMSEELLKIDTLFRMTDPHLSMPISRTAGGDITGGTERELHVRARPQAGQL